MPLRNIAKKGYEAYAKSTNNKNFRGEEMPAFDELPTAIQAAWMRAAEEIIKQSEAVPKDISFV